MTATREDWHLTVGLTRGGAERLLVEVLPRLAAAGRRPRVLALKGRGPVADDLEAAGIPVTPLGGRGRRDPRPIWRLLRMLRAEPPRRLHAHLTRAVMVAGWVCRGGGPPWFAHFHSLAGERPAWHDRLEGAAARRARARVAVSAAVAADRAERFGLPASELIVIPNGIDVDRYTGLAGPPGGPEVVAGFLGRLRVADKGLDVLLAAMARLRSRPDAPALRLEIAGGPEEEARSLAGRAAEMGLGSSVRVLGEVAGAAEVLPAWDLLVLPSRREGFGLVLLEAMAAGRPVVASRTGGIPEVVADGGAGLLVPPGEPESLAAALARLAGDPALRSAMGREARDQVRRRFDAATVARAWDALDSREIPGTEAT